MAIDPNQLQYQWRSYFGDNPDAIKRTYAVNFSDNTGKEYTFIPSSVINHGSVGVDQTAVLPWFLNQDNLKQFAQVAQPVDLSGVSWYGDWLQNNIGASTDGFLIPSGSLPFNSEIAAYNNSDIGTVKGISQGSDGTMQYITTGSHSNGYGNITNDGQLHNHWTESRFGGVLGDLLGGVNDLLQSAGPVLPIMANLVMPGLGTAITMGEAIGSGNIEGAAKNFLISQGVGASGISPAVADATGSQALGQLTAGTVGGLAAGQPLDKALTNAGLGTLAAQGSAAINQASTDAQLANWSQQQAEKAYNNAPSPTEQDVLAASPEIPIPGPLSTPTTATGPGYYNEQTGAWVSDPNGPLQHPLTDASGNNIDSMNGYKYDPATQTWTAPDGQTYDMSYLSNSQTPYTPPSLDETTAAAFDATKIPSSLLQAGLNSLMNTGSSGGASQQAKTGFSYNDQFLDTSPQMLAAAPVTSSTNTSNSQMKQIYDTLTPELKNVLAQKGVQPNFTYGQPSQPTQAAVKPTPEEIAQAVQEYSQPSKFMAGGGLVDDAINPRFAPLAKTMLDAAPVMEHQSRMSGLRHLGQGVAGGRRMSMQGFAHGGLPHKYAEATPDGHKPEFITGLTGYYASGKGTGQSDDIDAMLHDGDYVADADLVAALGDGSSKAGAEALEKFRRSISHHEHAEGGQPVPAKIADGEYVFPASFVTALGKGDNKAGAKLLDKMREEVRAHKRSAPDTKIPPKAKSPLDYLKMAKG
jgi:hypothetical protein